MTLTPQQMPALQAGFTGRTAWGTAKGVSYTEIRDERWRPGATLSGEQTRHLLGLLADLVRDSGALYWVHPDMIQVAGDAQAGMKSFRLGDLPSKHGVVGFGEPFMLANGVSVDAVAWGVADIEEGASLQLAFRMERGDGRPSWIDNMVQHIDFQEGRDLELPPLVAPGDGVDDPELAEIWSRYASMLRIYFAAMGLMQIPTVAEMRPLPVPAKVAKKRAKKGRVDPEVRIVTLRPMRNENVTHSPSGRKYHHRWLVRGHWRNQACGPKQSERKRTWVPSYTKGPDGAPLIGGDLVKVWKR